MPSPEKARRLRASRRNSALGAVLGLGAPLGYLAIRMVAGRRQGRRASVRRELLERPYAYAYMGLTTPLVFSLFGRSLGRREEELRRTHEELQRLREEFIAIVAHDLKNPIQAILLQAKLLRRRARGDQVVVPVEFLDRLERTAERLRGLVNDLMDASLVEAHRLSLLLRPVSLEEALPATIAHMRETLGPRPIHVVVEGAPPQVAADRNRLDQIVVNLLENAAKYSASGTPIVVRIRPDDARGASFSVEDRGAGIPAEELPRLFDRFYQAQRSRERKTGLGLGLYITKGLVEAHGGYIGVASAPGVGSVFTVWLPAA